MDQTSATLFVAPPPQGEQRGVPDTLRGADGPGSNLRLTARDDDILHFLYLTGYAQTDQIAAACFSNIVRTSRLRATQRRLKQLANGNLVRAIEQPIYPRQRTGSRSLIYTLAGNGGARAADRLGLHRRDIDTRPKPRETNISWLGHTLELVSYWLALRRSCAPSRIELENWVTDRVLQKEPAKVEIHNEQGNSTTIGVVPDACYRLSMPDKTATFLLELDRATVTLQPAAWSRKGWRRKVLGLLALTEDVKLKEHCDTDVLWVKVVTKNQDRLDNMLKLTAATAGKHAKHFWFTTEDQLQRNILTEPIWRVAGMQGTYAVAAT